MDYKNAQFKTVWFDFPSARENTIYVRPTHNPTLRLLNVREEIGAELVCVLDPNTPHSRAPKDYTRLCTMPIELRAVHLTERGLWEPRAINDLAEMYTILNESYQSLNAINTQSKDELAQFGFTLASSEPYTEIMRTAHQGLSHEDFVWLHYKLGLVDLEKRLEFAQKAAENRLAGRPEHDTLRNPIFTDGRIIIPNERTNFRTPEGPRLPGWLR